jgi:cytochrome P450
VSDVRDWATDFDHADPAYNAHVHEIWADLRGRCPVAHSPAYGGTWLPVRHEDVRAIAYDTDHFSSEGVVVSTTKAEGTAPLGGAPPITADPPAHHDARRILLPAFAPKVIAALEPEVRALCRRLLDAVGDADVVDGAVDYAQHIPPHVIAGMLGFPQSDAEMFRGFVHDVLEGIDRAPEDREAAFLRLDGYLQAQIDDHVARPREDLTSQLLATEVGGAPVSRDQVRGTILLLLIAGIDTTWSGIGSALWHLAATPSDLARLVAEPALVDSAIEEFLRAYAPVTMARIVKQEVVVGGCTMRPRDWVLLPFPAANRDPEVFDRADEVLIDRAENRHAAFGLGIHRCVGSNLARLEMKVAVEEFIARFPEFRLADPSAVTWSVGQVRGPRRLPIRIARRA